MSYIGTITSAGGIVVVEIAGGVRHPVYRGLLAQHSEYFKTALKGPWKEAEEGEVHLEDVQCAPFNIFVTWLYTQKIVVQAPSGKIGEEINDLTELKATMLGDCLLAPAFTKAMQEHTIKMYTTTNKAVPFNVVAYAYQNLRNDNPILELLADLHVYLYVEKDSSKVDAVGKDEVDLPIKFLPRIMHKYAQKNTMASQKRVYACGYIGHSTTAGAQCVECRNATKSEPVEMFEEEEEEEQELEDELCDSYQRSWSY